ncbi:Stress response protein NhaX [Marinomonas spartinae]|uniref:universal stress protein n=1 Tax=Marinomonas spartinae TaxID=1792290 RepID=UPI000808A215|nr:universal stress protein [Marinomonas spartinae]SBS27505.1 Stress response protein NhaX [Marinomonas spartinae]
MLPEVNTILYACDLEGQTQSALGHVMNLALAHQAKVVVMHVLEPLGAQATNMITNYLPEETTKAMREEAVKNINEKMRVLLSDYINDNKEALSALAHPPETKIAQGIPYEAIIHVAEKVEADIIVMNSRTHSRFGQMIIGSTANKVIHHSNIPVLVVPIKAHK